MVEVNQIIHKSLVATAIADPFKLEVYYEDTHKWEVVVTHVLSETVKKVVVEAMYVPTFGIDVSDWSNITAHAEALCEEILGEINVEATSVNTES